LLYRSIANTAAFLYRSADFIAVVTPAFREQLIRKWNVPAEKISIIQNGVETALFSPRNADQGLTQSLKTPAQFLVSFIGTLGLAHGLDTLISAAEQLQSIAPEVVFMLVGDGADRERIVRLVESKKLCNVRFVAQQSRERIPAYIAASDACVVTLKKSEVFETVIPTKMLEFMSCGRPVILAVKGEAQRILEAAGGGLCIEPGNPRALCDAILMLRQRPDLCESMGRSGRSYISRELSRESTATEYLRLLRAIVGESATQPAVAA